MTAINQAVNGRWYKTYESYVLRLCLTPARQQYGSNMAVKLQRNGSEMAANMAMKWQRIWQRYGGVCGRDFLRVDGCMSIICPLDYEIFIAVDGYIVATID